MELNDLDKNKIDLRDIAGSEQPPEKAAWAEEPRGGKPVSWIYSKINKLSSRVFFVMLGVFVLVAAAAGFYIYSYLLNRDISFSLSAPQNVLLGVPFNLEINAKNNFSNALNEVKISFVLPEGVVFEGGSAGKRFFEKSFGTLEKDANFQEEVPLIIIPNGQDLKKFDVKISYYAPALGPTAGFEQVKTAEVLASESAFKFDIVAPQGVRNNEDFEINVRYQNISGINLQNAGIKLTYPDFFTFKGSTVSPSSGNNIWNLGDLAKNGPEGSFVIKGRVVSSSQTFFEIGGEASAEVSGQKYLMNKKIAQLSIASSPLFLEAVLNGQQDNIIGLNQNLRYKLNYRNNSAVGLNDVIITAKISGAMFDISSLQTNGFFDSKNNVITWNVANTPELRVVNPGAGGTVDFQIQTKELYPIKKESDKNFTLDVLAGISSPTVEPGVASDKTVGFANLKTNISGAIAAIAGALYYDPASGFSSGGPYPPKTNKATKFTIRLSLINYSTDVSGVRVSAFLQSGVRWTGQVKSGINSLPAYNERTQEITWDIDKIIATKGVISKPVEAVFQVEATPNITQSGQPMPLLDKISVQAHDDFNNIDLNASALPVDSKAAVE